VVDKKLETLAYRLKDLSTLRNLFSELNFDFADKPVNKDNWNDEQKKIVQEAKIIASKDDYKIYYIQTNTDSLKEWKSVSTKIIKDNNGLCMICSHNPSGFKWIFSSLSKDFSKSFSETRHVPIDINPDSGVPSTFVEFLEKIRVEKESTSTSILSQISDAFDSFAVQIHDELTVNVFEALKVLSEGIIGDKNNNLPLTDETLEDIREPIFILLYRIIFILYAEDRGIFPVDNKIYQEEFSLKWIKEEWLLKSVNTKQLAEYDVEKRVKKLFRLIEIGSEELDYDKEEFFMRSYYGRIFDRKINHRIEEWHISNANLLEMLSLLTRTKDKKGNYFFLDYSALETRHLGHIYEQLLAYHLKAENNKIKELPDPKDRKESGSYYTPKYVVDDITKNSIEPLIDSIIEKNPDKQIQVEKILSLKILDPAMGSGHFLVGAVEYIAKRLCEIEFGEISEYEYIERKRDVVRRCIYGVDINPLSVDLARLSLWLETLSSEKPLSFLSSHLKCGNSLVGEKISSLFDKQTTLFESEKGRSSFRKNLKKFLMFETLEDDSSSTVKMKLEEYSKMQSKGTIYYDLKFLLDSKTAEFFGVTIPNLGDYRAKIGENSLDFYTDDVFEKVKALSEQKKFFHWELEFPQVFFDETGTKLKNPNFDCVLGNPPYIDSETMTKNASDLRDYCVGHFESASGNWDIFCVFIEKGLQLCNNNGYYGNIIPNKLLSANYANGICNVIRNHSVSKICDYSSVDVFGVDVYPIIITISKQKSKVNSKINIEIMKESISLPIISEKRVIKLSKLYDLDNSLWASVLENEESINLYNYIYSKSKKFGDIDEIIIKGAASVNEAYEIKKIIQELTSKTKNFKKFINTGTIDPYVSLWGIKPTTYIKSKFTKPVVLNQKLDNLYPKRFIEANTPKVIVAGMTKGIEAFYDENNEYLAGKSTTIVHSEKFELKIILVLLNSKITKFLAQRHKGIALAGGYLRIGPPLIKELLVPTKLLVDQESNDDLIKLVQKLQIVKQDSEIHNNECLRIENDIDEKIFELFELDQNQKLMILDQLNNA
jgi:hypothetical protein